MKRVHTQMVAALALVVACGGIAQAEVWTGAGDGVSYGDTNNWDNPATAFPGSTRDINSAATVVRNADVTVNRTFVSGGATLNVTGGSQRDSQSGSTIRNFVGRGSAGTLNMSGGTYDVGHLISIGGGGANGDGKVYVTGGILKASRGSNAANMPSGVVGGYSLELGDDLAGNGDALFEISGGSFESRIGAGIGGSGTFSVIGSGATSIGIGSNGSLDGEWNQFGGGTLKMAIDGGGVTPIFIDDNDGGGVSVNFQSGSLLDLSFDGVAAYEGTWTLMEASNTVFDASTIAGLSLAGVTTGWSIGFDNVGGNGLLTATYAIPEPATLGMIAAMGGGLLFIRRRFMM